MNTTETIVKDFITTIWNDLDFDKIDLFLHPKFTDHSLPPSFPTDKEGLMAWVHATGRSFNHRTVIEEQVTEKDKCMIKFRMHLKHVGAWRDIEPIGAEISTIGYRYFRIADQKIIEHWALLDGNSIENLLKESAHGCKIQQ